MAVSGAPDVARHMDGIYRHQRYIYDATRKFYLLGRDTLLSGLKPPPGGRVLEVACGTGRNLLAASRRYPDATFYGFDISREMLLTARQQVSRALRHDRIVLAQGDAADFSPQRLFGVEKFDRVFISYAVSMIPDWRRALDAAAATLAPDGELHVVDFGQQSDLPPWFGGALVAWLRRFSVTPRAELENELRRVGGALGRKVEFTALYRDYARYGVIRGQG